MALSLMNIKRTILFLPHKKLTLPYIQPYNFIKTFSQKMENGHTYSIPTVGIIVIGNEILNGDVQDTNSHFIASKLYKLGVKLCKISVIPDNLEVIAKEVSTFSKLYTHVITTGGIGPTHDDITFESVAAAFHKKLKMNPQIVELIQDWYKIKDVKSPAMKMAMIPESSKLHFAGSKEKKPKARYPIVSIKNIFMFPGIPHLLQGSFDLLAEDLFRFEGSGFECGNIYLTEGEVFLAAILEEALKIYPQVTIGSYPELFHSYYKTKITMESLTQGKVEDAKAFIVSKVNEASIVNYKTDTISQPWIHIEEVGRRSTELGMKIEEAKSVLLNCFDRYNVDEICLCYNGGKDCLVVLHLAHAIMREKFPGKKIQAVYIPEPDSFPQLDQFIQQSITRYDINCDIIPGPIKSGLSNLLKSRPAIKAVVMGTRRGDPHSDKLTYFSPTDTDWPSIMRVNPIIDWEYHQVWQFLRNLYLPYCQLYDRGYSSIGGRSNTVPNPSLKCIDKRGKPSYLPAYLLVDAQHERNGRLGS